MLIKRSLPAISIALSKVIDKLTFLSKTLSAKKELEGISYNMEHIYKKTFS